LAEFPKKLERSKVYSKFDVVKNKAVVSGSKSATPTRFPLGDITKTIKIFDIKKYSSSCNGASHLFITQWELTRIFLNKPVYKKL